MPTHNARSPRPLPPPISQATTWFDLKWKAPFDNGMPILSYSVAWRCSGPRATVVDSFTIDYNGVGYYGVNEFLCINSPVNTTLLHNTVIAAEGCANGECSFNATGLLQDTAYDFQITPRNGLGEGAPSVWLQGDGTTPTLPFGFIVGCSAGCFFTNDGEGKLPPTPGAPSVSSFTR